MRLWTALAIGLMVAAPACAQTDQALELVPRSALGYLMVNDLSLLSARTETLAKKLKAPTHVSLLELIQRGMGLREGLNEKGSAIFIVVKKDADDPERIGGLGLVLAIPVTDAKKVLTQVGAKDHKDGVSKGEVSFDYGLLAGVSSEKEDKNDPGHRIQYPVSVARKGAFVLFGPAQDRSGIEAVLNCKDSLAAKLKPARAWLDQQEISGVCTDRAVKFGLMLMLSSPGANADSSTQGQAAKAKAFFTDLEKNIDFIAIGGGWGADSNAHLATRVYFDPAGAYAKWMAQAATLDPKIMERMPDTDPFLSAFARLSPQTGMDWLDVLIHQAAPEEKAAKLSKGVKQVLRHVSEVGVAASSGGGSDKLSGAVIAKVDDADAFLADATALAKGTVALMDKSRDASLTSDRVAEGRASVLSFSWMKNEYKRDRVEGTRQTNHVLLAPLDRRTALIASIDDPKQGEATLKKFAEPPTRSFADNRLNKQTEALLPRDPQLAVFVNLSRVGQLPGISSRGLPSCPPIGFALKAFDVGIEARFVMPIETVDAAFKTAMDMSK